MKLSFRDVERLAESADRPSVAIPTLKDGCRAILQWLANRPNDWQAIDSLNVGTLLDVERLIVGRAVSFSRTETGEPRTTAEGCQCRAEYLPDGSMGWIRPDGKPCDCEPTQKNIELVPIASARITAIGAELLANIGKPVMTAEIELQTVRLAAEATSKGAAKPAKHVRTEKVWTPQDVEKRIRLELKCGDASVEKQYLFATAVELEKLIGCNRKTAMKTTFWKQDRIELRQAWRRENSTGKRTRKRDI